MTESEVVRLLNSLMEDDGDRRKCLHFICANVNRFVK